MNADSRTILEKSMAQMDSGEYEAAFAGAMSALTGSAPIAPELMPDFLEVAGYCCEHFRSVGLETELPSDEDLHQLTELTMHEFSDPISSASVLSTLSRTFYDREDYPNAERTMARALGAVEIEEFDGRSSFLPDYEYLVNALCWQSKFDEGEQAARRWLAMAEAELYEGDIYTAKIHKMLADIYRAKEQPMLAEEHLKRCLWLHENEDCSECADVAGALDSYADLLDASGRNDEAESLRGRASAISPSEYE